MSIIWVMKNGISVVIITKNAKETLPKSLNSVSAWADEIVIVDNKSEDNTLEIAKRYRTAIFSDLEYDLGKQRAFGLTKTHNEWVLFLDSDEVVSDELREEIKTVISRKQSSQLKLACTNYNSAYYIPFQNHFLGRPIHHGGEDYKMLRLFKKDCVKINPSLVHEEVIVQKGKTGKLKNKIYHYSYRSLWQTYAKFTDYALREAKQKYKKKERASVSKIFTYPIHIFWARFVEDEGYKDGITRIVLDLAFAYMEMLTYVILLYFNFRKFLIKN